MASPVTPATESNYTYVTLSLVFNLELPGRARLCSSVGVSARQGAATA